MKNIISKAKKEFYKVVDNNGYDPFHMKTHLPEVERWAKFLLKRYKDANKEITLLGVWLHDIGHYIKSEEDDHSIVSEKKAKEFLEKQNYSKEKLKKVLHCVRSHRCRDIKPKTIEAKIVAGADSASHITEITYFDILKRGHLKNNEKYLKSKMKRDFNDISKFPELKEELKDMYHSWLNLIKDYKKIDY